MSWIPKVQNWTTDNERLSVNIAYYDSADTGRITALASRQFIVQPDEVSNPGVLGARIKLWGANAKAAQAQLAAANVAFPAGFELTPIP